MMTMMTTNTTNLGCDTIRELRLCSLPRRGRTHVIFYGRGRMTLAPLQCRDGARRVFTDQADIARTKREAP